MTNSDDVLAAINELVPSLPNHLFTDLRLPLKRSVSHGQMRALILAVQQLAPHVSSDAFTEHTTPADLVEWVAAATAESSPGPPPRGSYRSHNTTIRPLEPSDIPVLYQATLRPQSAHRWRFRGRTPSPEEFESVLFGRDVLAQFIVIEAGGGRPVGLVVGYDPDTTSGHCSVAVQRAWDHDRSAGLMFEGAFVMVQYLFDHFNLRKLYFDVPEYNLTLFSQSPGSLLVEEGRLIDHYYYGDRYWDRVTFALYRSTWDETAEGLRGRWPEGHFD